LKEGKTTLGGEEGNKSGMEEPSLPTCRFPAILIVMQIWGERFFVAQNSGTLKITREKTSPAGGRA